MDSRYLSVYLIWNNILYFKLSNVELINLSYNNISSLKLCKRKRCRLGEYYYLPFNYTNLNYMKIMSRFYLQNFRELENRRYFNFLTFIPTRLRLESSNWQLKLFRIASFSVIWQLSGVQKLEYRTKNL